MRNKAALARQLHFHYAASMFSKPRKLETEPELHEAAMRMLMRRAYSISEMKKALARRCDDPKIIRTVVDRLKEAKHIDDARYAKQFTRSRSEGRKQGPYRIARDLRARGVPDQHIDAALKDSAAESDPGALVRHRIARKMKLLRGEIDERKIASLYRSLLAAGFPSDLIRKEIHKLTHEEVPEVDTEVE
jgi:regulatory protein